MLKVEQNLRQSVKRNQYFLFLAAITVLAAAVRWLARDFESGDMWLFLLDWYNEIKNGGGLSYIRYSVGNYNLLYITFLAVLTYLPIEAMYGIKLLSVVFDWLLAWICGCFVCELCGKKRKSMHFLWTYTIVLLLPEVFLNSAMWGQCDSIYTFFCVLFLYKMYQKRYLPAFLAFGMAFAFKFQTIFLLPFTVMLYFCTEGFSMAWLGLSAVTFWSTGCVAFLMGRSRRAPFEIYFGQAADNYRIALNANSFWVFAGQNYEAMHTIAFVVAFALLGMGLLLCMSGRKRVSDPERFLNTCVWTLWTCLLFLPSMHERYTYPMDILLILLCFINHRYLKYAVVSGILTLINYNCYLFEGPELYLPGSLVFFAAWVLLSVEILRRDLPQQKEEIA